MQEGFTPNNNKGKCYGKIISKKNNSCNPLFLLGLHWNKGIGKEVPRMVAAILGRRICHPYSMGTNIVPGVVEWDGGKAYELCNMGVI